MTNADTAQLARMKGFSFSFVMFKDVKLVCDVSTSVPRPVVPVEFRRCVFDTIHNLSHAGTRATRRLITKRWVWMKMQADVSKWCKECIQCQVSKVTRHTVPELQEIPVPSRWFTEVSLAIGVPLPADDDRPQHQVDRGDRAHQHLHRHRGIRVHPNLDLEIWSSSDLVTNRGCQFTGELWSTMCKKLHFPPDHD